MAIYIALLRSINVGGNNKIKMADLKNVLEGLELERVQTYIQSGNVLFESQAAPDWLRLRIEEEIRAVFGISTTAILRTAAELEKIIADCPYANAALVEGESIHVSLLTEPPLQKAIDYLAACERKRDEYQIHGREVYFLLRQSILDSKLAKGMQKLGDIATTRNWNTMNKLDALAKAMQD